MNVKKKDDYIGPKMKGRGNNSGALSKTRRGEEGAGGKGRGKSKGGG